MTDPLRLDIGGAAQLHAVMSVMTDAFDPRFGEAWTHAQCAGLLPMPGVWLTLATSGGRAVGFSLARIVVDEAELLLLAVRPEMRAKGVGRALLEHFAAAAGGKGATRLHLEVRDGNGALNLYEKAGFTLAGRRLRYYSGTDGQQYDALSLSRAAPLSAASQI